MDFLSRRPLSVTIYYFPPDLMDGDLDNVVEPILDAPSRLAYADDEDIERLAVQKFEPQVDWFFACPSEALAVALDAAPPVLYIRIDDDLSWRNLP